jgi:hypothetical protein
MTTEELWKYYDGEQLRSSVEAPDLPSASEMPQAEEGLELMLLGQEVPELGS